MEGLNRVTLLGNLGQDSELRYGQSGAAVLNFRIACMEKFQNRDREWQERTEWATVVLFGKRGEALSKYLTKGTRVLVEGRLQTRSWEAKGGGKRYTTEVVATNIVMLGGRGQGGRDSEEAPPHSDDHDAGGFGDDQIPFSPHERDFQA